MTTKTRAVRAVRIKANNPVREAFAGRSTGSVRGPGRNNRIHTGYYDTKGYAVHAFDTELRAFNLCLDQDDLADFPNDEGRKTVAVHDESGDEVGCAVFTWHRMPSGRYEFIGYLA